jgi:hypothetical protein
MAAVKKACGGRQDSVRMTWGLEPSFPAPMPPIDVGNHRASWDDAFSHLARITSQIRDWRSLMTRSVQKPA